MEDKRLSGKEEEFNWINNLKEGDEVIVSGRFNTYNYGKVLRTTRTLIILENPYNHNEGRRYKKENGFMLGSDIWNTERIIMPTQEIKDKILLNKKVLELRNLIEKTAFIDLGINNIEKIIEIFKNIKLNQEVKK